VLEVKMLTSFQTHSQRLVQVVTCFAAHLEDLSDIGCFKTYSIARSCFKNVPNGENAYEGDLISLLNGTEALKMFERELGLKKKKQVI